MSAMTACPSCNGAAAGIALVMTDGVCSPASTMCGLCCGAPNIPLEIATEWRTREAGRIARINRGQSLRDRAAELGITPLELSSWEHGKDLVVAERGTTGGEG